MLRSITRVTAIALLATAFAVPQGQAQTTEPAKLRSLEDAIESSTDAVLMPTSVPGTLTFRGSKARTLEVNAESKFFVGPTQVTLAEFNAYVRRTGSQFMMVFSKPDGTVVTRLQVYGQM